MRDIYDYVKVFNLISKDDCKTLLEHSKSLNYSQHAWTFGAKNKFKEMPHPEGSSTELSITHPDNESINKMLTKYVHHACIKYDDIFYEQGLKANHLYNNRKKIVSTVSRVRLNKYDPNTEMKYHHDHIHSIFDGENRGIPTLSIVGLLNDDFKGGDFIFNRKDKTKLKAGDILVFPSLFIYGHRVDKIIEGTRHSFVAWAYG